MIVFTIIGMITSAFGLVVGVACLCFLIEERRARSEEP